MAALCALAVAAVLFWPAVVMAQQPNETEANETKNKEEFAGQVYLDEAVQLKLSAKTMGDLEKTVELCEQALAEGLDEGGTQFAKSLLGSTLYEHAARITESIFEGDRPPGRWPVLRRLALRDLEKAIEHDKKNGEAQLLIAKLHWLPGGDRQRGREAANLAVQLLADDNLRRSQALVLRAQLAEDDAARLADYNEAVRLDARNIQAWRGRGMYYLAHGESAKAVDDFLKLLELDSSDPGALQAAATALSSVKRLDEALTYVNKAIELEPDSAVGYKLRAQIHAARNDTKSAVDDLTSVLETEPGDAAARLMRARLWLEQGDLQRAKADVSRVLDLNPGLPQAILLRSLLAAAEDRYADAIADLMTLLRDDPENVELRMQIAAFYYQDKRPSKSIEVCTAILADDHENWRAYRLRADSYLLIGKHAEAIADYEASLKIEPDENGILNNLAWVLATSPKDEIRNGTRSIELAKRACEATEYKAAHILSTLAAGYAETADFESAIKWSEKAVKQAKEDIQQSQEPVKGVVEHLKEQLEQLENELDTYKKSKPWRELIETTEKADPPMPAADDLRVKESDTDARPSTAGKSSEPGKGTDDNQDERQQDSSSPDRQPSTDPTERPGAPEIDASSSAIGPWSVVCGLSRITCTE
jgi:tetratricopeptide (TPR) repeat protein